MNRGNPLGLALILAGAVAMVVSTFLPLNEPVGMFRFVQQNTLIQHDGCMYVVGAIALAGTGVSAYFKKYEWPAPLIVSIIGVLGIILWATNTSMRTLYPVGLGGAVDSSKPGQVADWGISIYVAGLGVLLGIVGSLTLGQWNPSAAQKSAPTALKLCSLTPRCANTADTGSPLPQPLPRPLPHPGRR